MDGLLLVDKSPGMTSHDVVRRVRKLAGTRKVGHTGTLDPDATGLLPITIGACTKLAQYLILEVKVYAFGAELGSRTDTDDASGEVVETADWAHVTREAVDGALDRFRGDIMQRPPRYSAIRVNGRRAYDLAREGVAFELEPRPVSVLELRVDTFEGAALSGFMRCTSGTYVRSLVRDLGEALGTCAHTTMIRRTQVGGFSVERAKTLEALEEEGVASALLSPVEMMSSLPLVAADAAAERALGYGQAFEAAGAWSVGDVVAVTDASGQALLAICEVARADGEGALFKPRRVLRAVN